MIRVRTKRGGLQQISIRQMQARVNREWDALWGVVAAMKRLAVWQTRSASGGALSAVTTRHVRQNGLVTV
jgi:hypothetical protein